MNRRKTDRLIFRLMLAGMLTSAILSGMAIHAMWKFDKLIQTMSDRAEERRAIERYGL